MSASSNISFRNPASPFERDSRDLLLMKSLREGTLDWSYDAEYPLVLSTEGNSTSWCAFMGNQLIGHANLWPRTLKHSSEQKSIPIGLVGNVATDENFRGQGHMRSLIAQLENLAYGQSLCALVLWSDLLEFYQNFGFSSIGREWRLTISRSERPYDTGLRRVDPSSLTDTDLSSMMTLRPRLEWGVERSPNEFKALLTIPNSLVFVRRRGVKIVSWMIIGKGADLQAVIHEWGALSPDELIADIQTILSGYLTESLTLLAPGQLHHHWLEPLKQRSSQHSEHAMALAAPIGPKGEQAIKALARSFIWGLDSI